MLASPSVRAKRRALRARPSRRFFSRATCARARCKWHNSLRAPIIRVGGRRLEMRFARALLVSSAVLGLISPQRAAAQVADRCFAVSEGPTLVRPASVRLASLGPAEVRLTFVGHATWLIESAGGVRIATDYNDYVRPEVVPDIATMNRAHTTHYSNFPDPGIKQLLRGWNPEGGPIKHDITLLDVRVRNVSTNIRDWNGGHVPYGHSIFILEVAGICIGQLGDL